MNAIITIIHVLICLILIVVVLLQSGKAADLAGAFGGVGSQTAFGPRGTASVLSKLTTISAVLFMVTSIGLWMLSARGQRSVVKAPAATSTTVPVTKEPTPTGTPAQKSGANPPTAQQGSQPTTQPAAPAAVTPKAPAKKTESAPQKKPS